KQRLCLCHKNLTRANRSFLYDADYIAGSPQWFEKYPQDFPFSEQAPCENESERTAISTKTHCSRRQHTRCKQLLARIGSTRWGPTEYAFPRRERNPFAWQDTSVSQPKTIRIQPSRNPPFAATRKGGNSTSQIFI